MSDDSTTSEFGYGYLRGLSKRNGKSNKLVNSYQDGTKIDAVKLSEIKAVYKICQDDFYQELKTLGFKAGKTFNLVQMSNSQWLPSFRLSNVMNLLPTTAGELVESTMLELAVTTSRNDFVRDNPVWMSAYLTFLVQSTYLVSVDVLGMNYLPLLGRIENARLTTEEIMNDADFEEPYELNVD